MQSVTAVTCICNLWHAHAHTCLYIHVVRVPRDMTRHEAQ